MLLSQPVRQLNGGWCHPRRKPHRLWAIRHSTFFGWKKKKKRRSKACRGDTRPSLPAATALGVADCRARAASSCILLCIAPDISCRQVEMTARIPPCRRRVLALGGLDQVRHWWMLHNSSLKSIVPSILISFPRLYTLPCQKGKM